VAFSNLCHYPLPPSLTRSGRVRPLSRSSDVLSPNASAGVRRWQCWKCVCRECFHAGRRCIRDYGGRRSDGLLYNGDEGDASGRDCWVVPEALSGAEVQAEGAAACEGPSHNDCATLRWQTFPFHFTAFRSAPNSRINCGRLCESYVPMPEAGKLGHFILASTDM
jgi:hypothetical protein